VELVVHRHDPPNRETSFASHGELVTTPCAIFFKRNHFPIPSVGPGWRLHVGGLVERPLQLALDELRALPATSLKATLECAGNGRTSLMPPTEGEPWGLGAVSTADWTGVPLADVLDRAQPLAEASHVVMRGADAGPVRGRDDVIRFERSLSLDEARDTGAILAYEMNGEPLPVDHGFPLRVIVPGWYGVASVKWLTEIEVTCDVFDGYFQSDRYVYEWTRERRTVREPVTRQRVRSVIVSPVDGARIAGAELVVRGLAWSGHAPVVRVEVAVGDREWEDAKLGDGSEHLAWRWWELRTRPPGRGSVAIRARATDAAGFVQPERPEWNRLGYGANGIHVVVAIAGDA
jgi:DMSO/TMAO reductase YedYZ molybdopterin-dependent catalytic subunit